VTRRRSVSVVLALLLAMQWATAAAHCLRFAPVSGLVELCTPDGVRQVPWPGQDVPAPGKHAAQAVCAACALPTGAAPPAPLALPVPVAYATMVAYVRPAPRAPPARTTPTPVQPRAPPAA